MKYIKTLRGYIRESIESYTNDTYIRYETSDKKAYAEISEVDNNTWYISIIESTRKGGGSELMKRIISDAKEKGIEKITLLTTEHSGWGFFDKFGFVDMEENNDPFNIPMVLYL
jgi:hypothetical protein